MIRVAFIIGDYPPAERRLREDVAKSYSSAEVEVGIVSIAVTVATGSDARVPDGISPWAFPIGLVLIDVTAVCAVGVFTWLLRDMQFGTAMHHAGMGSPKVDSRPAR